MIVSFSPMPIGAVPSDALNLWQQPAQWSTARSRVHYIHSYYDVFQTPAQGGATTSPWTLQELDTANAFAQMTTWGIGWEIEIWPLVLTAYRGHPVLPNQIQASLDAIGNIVSRGGALPRMRVEWGYLYGVTGTGGYTGGQTYSMAEMADDFAALVNAVHAVYPGVLFGDQEPIMRLYFSPYAQATYWDQWLTLLEARGVQLTWMDCDTFDYPPGAYPEFSADIAAARAVCASHGVTFGAEVSSAAHNNTDDQVYFGGTMALIQSFKNAIGTPERIQFRAWDAAFPGIPLNLPETAPYSHTHLINVGLDLLEGTTPPVANFTASQVPSTLTMQFLDTST